MFEQLKKIQQNVSIGEVYRLLLEMNLTDLYKEYILSQLKEVENSSRRTFILVYNGEINGYAVPSMMNDGTAFVSMTAVLETYRGNEEGLAVRKFDFKDTILDIKLSWVFKEVA